MSNNDIKHRLRKAQKSVTTWLIDASNAVNSSSSSSSSSNSTALIGKRISTPQLIRRTLHVAYDTETGNFIGVPTEWKSEFDSLAQNQPQLMHAVTSTKPKSRVWYDQCNRRFVNLPTHWRDRLMRNNLSDWQEFQRNPDLLTTIFTLMDEELSLMDLTPLGLDSTFYSSLPSTTSTEEGENGKVVGVAATAHLQHQQPTTGQPDEVAEHQPDGNAKAAASAGSRNATNTARSAAQIVWTHQRSFARDDESDSEEFAEL